MGYDDQDTTKLLIAAAIAVVSFVSAAAPMKLIQVDAHFFSVGNLLASGILLAGGLVHQLPDSIEKFEQSLGAMKFPLGPFISGLTFCTFMILEEYLHTQFSDHHFPASPGKGRNSHDHNHDHSLRDSINDETARLLFPPAIPPPQDYRTTESGLSTTSSSHHRGCNDIETGCGAKTCRHDSFIASQHDNGRNGSGSIMMQSFHSKTFALEHQHHHHQEHVAEHMHGSLLSAIILLCALSIHSILEGLAIGISSNKAEVFSTTMAVLAHKAFASYALGSSMVASEMKETHFYVLVSVFTFCSVLGIFLGMVFEEVNITNKNSSATGIIQAMVAGTFLFVSIVEIGMKEILLCRDSKLMGDKMSRKDMEWNKLVAFLVGYLAMSSLAVII
jgi:zinc transporter 1/2/3